MKRKIFFGISILVVLVLFVCYEFFVPHYVKISEMEGVVFPVGFRINGVKEKRWAQNKHDILLAEALVKLNMKDHCPKSSEDFCPKVLLDFTKFKRQYYGYFNEYGQKIIDINYLPRFYKGARWKMGPVLVSDGGWEYFHLVVNIETKKIEPFNILDSW